MLSPFLRLLTPEKLSLITIMEIMHLHGSGGVNDGGRAVEQEYKAQGGEEQGRERLAVSWSASWHAKVGPALSVALSPRMRRDADLASWRTRSAIVPYRTESLVLLYPIY